MMKIFGKPKGKEQSSSFLSEDDSQSSPAPTGRKTTTIKMGNKMAAAGDVEQPPEVAGTSGGDAGLPPLGAGTGFSTAALHLAETFGAPPTRPKPSKEEHMVEVKGARRDGPVDVSDTLALFVSSWNMSGCTTLPTKEVLSGWIPRDFDLYSIALQYSKSARQFQERILEYLGDEFVGFKYILLGQSTLLLFARKHFVQSGVLAQTRINEMIKCEVKTKSLVVSNATGRGCILMQMRFHNTTMAFVALNLDDDTDGLERRTADLEFCLKASGIVGSEVNEIGTPVLTSVQHVFLFGNFGVKSIEKYHCEKKNAWKGKGAGEVYGAEFTQMCKLNPALEQFDEITVKYPPTSRRRIQTGASATLNGPLSPRGAAGSTSNAQARSSDLSTKSLKSTNSSSDSFLRRLSGNFISIFEKDFDVDSLFDPKLIKKEGEPSHEDRIFYRTHEQYSHLLEPDAAGSCENVRNSTHVPVYCTFSMCGLDDALLKRWQVISGNLPVENATRTDTYMLNGVVSDFLNLMNAKTARDQADADERERLRQEYLSKQRLCDRCFEPLALEGGDVELGDDKGAYHRKCFACEDCGKDLLSEKMMIVEGKLLCWDSYTRIYQAPCPVCKENVLGECIRVGRDLVSYHVSCFRCTTCNDPLWENNEVKHFLDLDGKPYCPKDFEVVKDNCCMACKMSLNGDVAPGQTTFHSKCFHCAVCGIDMSKTNLKIVVRDHKVFCEIDHLKDLVQQEKKKEYLEGKQSLVEQVEEEKRKEQEMMNRRISMIPKGFNLSTFDIGEDDDIAEEEDDDD